MTKARDLANIISGGFTADDIPNIDASKITTGTFADARISASSVSQHATSFDDNKIVNDISTLALRQASDQNKVAYNTNSSFVDVFQDATGIDTTTNVQRDASEYISSVSESTSAVNDWETGDRRSEYTATSTVTISNPILNGLDGNFTNSGTNAWYFSSNGQSGSITWTLNNGVKKEFQGIRFYADVGNGSGTWTFAGSNDGVNFTNLANVDWYDGNSVTWSNSTAYNILRASGGSTTDVPWQQEQQFYIGNKITPTVNATGNFTGTTITAPSSVSSMGAIITYQDNAGTNALNTDIVLQLSADGGSNYSTATLTALPNFATGIKMAKVNDLAVTAGTQLKYKISFANQALGSKEARIRGVALQY